MLTPLQAERQLQAIEAASVPHMEKKDVATVTRRYVRLMETERQDHRADSLHEALQQAGVTVKQVPTQTSAADATGQAGTGRKGGNG